MAEYIAEDLAIIVRYDGTKSAFEAITDKSDYYGKVVFITGTTSGSVTTGQAIWVSETGSTTGKYLDMSNIDDIAAQLTYVKNLKVGNTSYAGSITIAGSNGISVSASSSGGVVTFTFSGATLESNIATASNTANSALSKANANATNITNLTTRVSTLENDRVTTDELNTAINASKSYTDAQVEAAKEYAEEKAEEAMEAAVDAAGGLATAAKQQAIDASDISITDDSTTGVYTVYQGGTAEANKVGTIDIRKNLVVSGGSVVKGTLDSNGNFTESASGTTYIKLTIASGDDLYIEATSLIDTYTAEDTDSIDMTVNGYKISATVKSNSINTSNLINSAVSTAKIADKAVTNEKIADGAVTTEKIAKQAITGQELSNDVRNALTNANSAIQSVKSSAAPYISATTDTSKKEVTITATTTALGEVEGNTLLGAQNGLATADDVFAYLKARLSVKVIS